MRCSWLPRAFTLLVAPGLGALACGDDVGVTTSATDSDSDTTEPSSTSTAASTSSGSTTNTNTDTNTSGESESSAGPTTSQGSSSSSDTSSSTDTGVDQPCEGNSPPLAVADFYVSKQRQLVAVGAAQGLLANDTDPDGDLFLLKVVAVDAISAGGAKISFDPSGGFTYDPPRISGATTPSATPSPTAVMFLSKASPASASNPAPSTSRTSPPARAAS
jgi:hypothetical protein